MSNPESERFRLLAEESNEAWEAVRRDGDQMLEASRRKRFEKEAAERDRSLPRYTVIGYQREGDRYSGIPSRLQTATDLDATQLVYSLAYFFRQNRTLLADSLFHFQIYEDGRLVWDDINAYGYIREYNDIRPENSNLTVAADYLEEHHFNDDAIAFLRHYGKEITMEDSIRLNDLRERFINERIRLAQELARRTDIPGDTLAAPLGL